jgi:hypothetical protein
MSGKLQIADDLRDLLPPPTALQIPLRSERMRLGQRRRTGAARKRNSRIPAQRKPGNDWAAPLRVMLFGRWGSAADRPAGHLSAAAGCAERTIRRSRAVTAARSTRLSQPWHRHSRHDDAAVVEAIVAGHGLSGCGPAGGFPARSSSPMPYGSSSAAGDVGVVRTGSRNTRAMQPSAARGETKWSSSFAAVALRLQKCGGPASELARRGPRVGFRSASRRSSDTGTTRDHCWRSSL